MREHLPENGDSRMTGCTVCDRREALYVIEERSYLYWTCLPEVSYIIEYDHSVVSDDEIIQMAESAKSWDNK